MMIVIVALTVSARAATYTVTNTADSGVGSLRAMVTTINAAPPGSNDTINFVIPTSDAGCTSGVCTITLSSEIAIFNNNGGTHTVTIAGTGADKLILSGNNTNRIFNINSGNVTLDGIKVTGGKSILGGAILFSGSSLTISNSVFTNNTAVGGSGNGRNGGAVYCSGRCDINNSMFSGNSVPAGFAGALFFSGSPGVTLNSISNTVITGNTASEGGGIYQNYGSNTISNSIISNNTAAYGGAIEYNSAGSEYISNSTLTGNTTTSNGGAIYNFFSSVYLTDVTISNNSSSNGSGGAMYIDRGNFYFTNSTVSNNSSKYDGGGIYAYTANVYASKMLNTIVSGNTATASTMATPYAQDYFGPFQSLGYNILGDGTGATITGTTTGNQVGTTALPINAKLSPLAYHGGFGLTRALLVGSPAIDAGTTTGDVNNVVPALDQRGASRIGATDIGAFEFNNTNFVAALPNGVTLLVYGSQLVPDRGTFTYSLTGGSLPPGMFVTTSGITVSVTGTPTLAGTYNFTVTGIDGINTTVTNYTITVLSPTASNVSIGGRILTYNGRGIGNVRITLSDAGGSVRTAMSNPFGYYNFTDIEAGQTVIVSARSKRFYFGSPTRVVSVSDELTSVDFTALP